MNKAARGAGNTIRLHPPRRDIQLLIVDFSRYLRFPTATRYNGNVARWFSLTPLLSLSFLLFFLPVQAAQKKSPASDLPALADQHYQKGLQAIQKRDWPVATRELRLTLKYAPKFPPAHDGLGWVYLQTGKVDDAAIEFRKAIALEPHFAEAYYNMGRALEARQDIVGAITFYQGALKFRPDWPEARLALGIVLRQKGDVEGAIKQFQQALKLTPDFAPAHYQLGLALRQKGEAIQAQAEFEKAHQIDPNLQPPAE